MFAWRSAETMAGFLKDSRFIIDHKELFVFSRWDVSRVERVGFSGLGEFISDSSTQI
jgi:hypothetical protein